jgi:putative ABC transport system permease protein
MLGNYLKIAFKVLGRRKFYTAVSLFGIAFTLLVVLIGAAITDEMYFPAYPETRLDRMLGIYRAVAKFPNGTWTSGPGYGLLDRFARDLPGVERLSIVSNANTVAGFVEGEKVEARMRRTDGEFWEIMEFRFLEGGPYTVADERDGNLVAVINERTRERFFGGAPALGKLLRVDGQTFTVVGVVPDIPPTRVHSFAEIWAPIGTMKSTGYKRRLCGGFLGLLLAEDRSRFPEIKAEFQRRLTEADLSDMPELTSIDSRARTHLEELAATPSAGELDDDPMAVTWLFAAAIGLAILFMALPALNLVNLNLSRILERSSEIGVRKAFGASSRTLVGQFLVEATVLTCIGGMLGLLLAQLAMIVINRIDLVPYASVHVNYRVFAYALGLSLLFALLSGGYPAWRMSRMHPVDALRGRV